ncbi:hypothetical protein CEK28_10070 [Xenophilus sp. AP218F]|nr:hypothetical protein CEK28_10070 [Xenophilus sp. AP218F]
MHTVKPRNPLACAAIMKKGGAHGPSRSGQRQSQRQAMLAELDEAWEVRGQDRRLAPARRAAGDGEVFSFKGMPKRRFPAAALACPWSHLRH